MRFLSGINHRGSVILTALFAMHFVALGQYPGGVGEPLIWLLPNEQVNEEGVINKGKVHIELPKGASTAAYLNYHPLWKPSPLSVDSEAGLEAESTYFIVCQNAESATEESLWSIEREDTTRLIMTTQRFADMTRSLYADYIKSDGEGRLQSYIHRRDRDANESTLLTLFDRPRSKDLPVIPTERLVSEFIIYDRALSEKERIQVESYLAFKYGLTLRQPIHTMYLDSNGDIVWREANKGDFTNRVAAIGRDDNGTFKNLQSRSTLTDNPVSIAVRAHAESHQQNTSEISDASWLIWSDDNGPLSMDTERSTANTVGRQWSMDVLSARNLVTQVEIDTRQILTTGDVDVWWMNISREGQLPELYKATQAVNGIATFDSIKWDTDGSGTDRFSFLNGGDLMPALTVTNPSCGSKDRGTVHIMPYGGKMPYRIIIADDRDGKTSFEITEPLSVDLEAGIYEVYISDAEGLTWNGAVAVSSQGLPDPCLNDVLTLPGSGALLLNAELLCLPPEARVTIKSGSSKRNQSNINVTEPGRYILEVELDGCRSYHDFYVRAKSDGNFRQVSIFPNPVKCGDDIAYRILLEKKVNLTLTIHDVSGRQLHQQQLGVSDGFQGKLSTPLIPGSYSLSINSGTESTALQFITID